MLSDEWQQLKKYFSRLIFPQPNSQLARTLQKKADAELARQREAEKAARSYDSLFSGEEEEVAQYKSVQEMVDDFM